MQALVEKPSISTGNSPQYVLSFSTEMFFVLAGIGADDFVNQTVYIPQSAIQVLEDEYAIPVIQKNRTRTRLRCQLRSGLEL